MVIYSYTNLYFTISFVNNIISIKPIVCFDGRMDYPTHDCDCHDRDPRPCPPPPYPPEHIYDPFENV